MSTTYGSNLNEDGDLESWEIKGNVVSTYINGKYLTTTRRFIRETPHGYQFYELFEPKTKEEQHKGEEKQK